MVSQIISRIVILVFGTLYPAYASYKAVKTKNVKEYVKWMMYWIVFALFTCVETFSDLFVSWIPFYYELKIIFVLWLMSPATKGASILYRKFVHPQLSRREKVIDEYIQQATDQGYSAMVTMGSRVVSHATNVVVNTAMKGQSQLADHLRRSYSMSDVSQPDGAPPIPRSDSMDEDELDNRMIEESYQQEMAAEAADDKGTRVRRNRANTADPALYDVQEKDELEGREKTVNSKKTHAHKEAYHYATLPRSKSGKATRSSSKKSAQH